MRARTLTFLVAVSAPAFALPVPADAPDLVVDCTGQVGAYTTVQAAIDDAVSGDRIGVAPCEYHERIEFRGKALDVFGIAGSAQTILDGDGGGTVVKIREGEAEGTRLAGFTVRDGEDADDGSAIELRGASVELQDLVLTDNDESKSVLFALRSFVVATDVVITGNDVASDGQAIFSDGGSFVARGLVVDCDGGHEAIYHHNPLLLTESTVTCDNDGIYDYHGEDRLRRVEVVAGDDGIYAHDTESTVDLPDSPVERLHLRNVIVEADDVAIDVRYMTADLQNVVLVGDESALSLTACSTASAASATVFQGADCGITSDQPFAATRSSFWQNTQNGCGTPVSPTVTSDPRFVSATDHHLRANSPLVDAGPSGAANADPDGSRNDIGAYGGTWGAW